MNDRPFATRALALGFVSLAMLAACSSSADDAEAPPPPGSPGGAPTVPIGTPCTADATCGGGRCHLGGCVPGAACTDDTACAGARCIDGACVPSIASNGSKDGDESDVDCGGSVAPRCIDGKTCGVATDCANKSCIAGLCSPPSATDGLQNGTESDVDCGGAAPTNAPKCDDGKSCKAASDCVSLSCGGDGKCAPPSSSDGIKNGTETDVDCGGGAPTNAAPCAATKGCVVPTDCFWGHCDANVCGGHVPGTKDGDQTDIDCGGTQSPACDWYKGCNVAGDCTTKACGPDKKCLVGPSCNTVHGGNTCGFGEFGDGFKSHETCCKSLPVAGYADPEHNGKKVYLDKYEITAGRMRTFVNAIAAGNGGTPNIKGWLAAHRPAVKWNTGWEAFLPTANSGSTVTFNVTNPTGANLLNPGQDEYLKFDTQPSWSVGTGMFSVDVGVYLALGGVHLFPEYITGPGWPTPDYAAAHALNCGNGHGQYGWSTYWFDAATINQYSGGVGKANTQEVLDEKAMNCAPSAMFAAFCVWDGGQLATAEVMDSITGNTTEPVYSAAGSVQTGKLAAGNSSCGSGSTLNTFSDGSQGCYSLPNNAGFFPGIANDYDSSAKIASPGRVAADVVVKTAGDEPWMDMIGNLQEVVTKRNETTRFDYRGYGVEYGSIVHHKNQESTPRMKSGALGARCMRFK